MNMPDTMVAAQIDELLRRSSLRLEQQRINVAELADDQALHAEGVLTEMLASVDQLRKYQAKLRNGEKHTPGEPSQCAITEQCRFPILMPTTSSKAIGYPSTLTPSSTFLTGGSTSAK
jgi:hypothetical protein